MGRVLFGMCCFCERASKQARKDINETKGGEASERTTERLTERLTDRPTERPTERTNMFQNPPLVQKGKEGRRWPRNKGGLIAMANSAERLTFVGVCGGGVDVVLVVVVVVA